MVLKSNDWYVYGKDSFIATDKTYKLIRVCRYLQVRIENKFYKIVHARRTYDNLTDSS